MKNRYGAIALLAGVMALISACTPTPSGHDTSPPALDVSTPAAFVVGSQIDTGAPFDDYGTGFSNGIQALVSWSASDAGSGVCGYDLDEVYAGMAPMPLLEGTSDTSYVASETDYEDQFGGGTSKVAGWDVTAHDCAHNATKKFVGGRPLVVQEDGANVSGSGIDLAPVYAGNWDTSHCSCWSNGAVRDTTESGATATFTNTNNSRRIALVMERAANRGQFRVLVNGVERAIVDNGGYSPAGHRVVAWEGAIEPLDVVEVSNLATPGRPRIDLDAIILR